MPQKRPPWQTKTRNQGSNNGQNRSNNQNRPRFFRPQQLNGVFTNNIGFYPYGLQNSSNGVAFRNVRGPRPRPGPGQSGPGPGVQYFPGLTYNHYAAFTDRNGSVNQNEFSGGSAAIQSGQTGHGPSHNSAFQQPMGPSYMPIGTASGFGGLPNLNPIQPQLSQEAGTQVSQPPPVGFVPAQYHPGGPGLYGNFNQSGYFRAGKQGFNGPPFWQNQVRPGRAFNRVKKNRVNFIEKKHALYAQNANGNGNNSNRLGANFTDNSNTRKRSKKKSSGLKRISEENDFTAKNRKLPSPKKKRSKTSNNSPAVPGRSENGNKSENDNENDQDDQEAEKDSSKENNDTTTDIDNQDSEYEQNIHTNTRNLNKVLNPLLFGHGSADIPSTSNIVPHPDMNSYNYNLPSKTMLLSQRYSQNSISRMSNYAPSTISYEHDRMTNSQTSHNSMFVSSHQGLSGPGKSSGAHAGSHRHSSRPLSPTNSAWSIGTSATFRHDLKESHYNDMFNEFRENDLNNMERSQILQEYFFMERVNNFLEEKLFNITIKYPHLVTKVGDIDPQVNKQASKEMEGAAVDNITVNVDSTNNTSLATTTTATVNATIINDLKADLCIIPKVAKDEAAIVKAENGKSPEPALDLESTLSADFENTRPVPLTEEQLSLEKSLKEIGIDPVHDILDIKDQLEMIEVQVEARSKQLESERNNLREKLDSLIGELGEIKSEIAEDGGI